MAGERMTSSQMESGVDEGAEVTFEMDPNLAFELELAAKAAAAAKVEQEKKLEEALMTLAYDIEKKFEERKNKRATKDRQIIESIKLYYGNVFDSSDLYSGTSSYDRPLADKAPRKGSTYNIIKTKVDIAVAQEVSIQFGAGEKNWDILPSDYPTDENGAPVDKERAAQAAENMEGLIDSQFAACNAGHVLRLAIRDRVMAGAGIIKGPVNALLMEKKYTKSYTSKGKPTGIANLKSVERPTIERVHPLFFYPDNAPCIDDCEDVIQVRLLSKNRLIELASSANSGFSFKENILKCIEEGPKSFTFSDAFTQYTSMSSGQDALRDKYLVLEYNGLVSQDLLLDLGKNLTFDSPTKFYMAEVWVCQGRILRVELAALDGCYKVPYAVAPWEPDPSSVIGFSLPLFLASQQKVVNETYRMLLDNANITSGPQVVINREVIEPATAQDWTLKPDKIWFSTELGDGDVNKAFSFFLPTNVTESLQNIIMMAKGFSEEESGIPLMVAGIGSPQVQDSVTGAAIQQQNATVFSDYKNEEWDDCITEKVVGWFHDWNWENSDRDDIRGEFKIDVRTSSDYRNKQVYLRNMEKLSIEAAQNPAAERVIDMAALQRAKIAMMSLPPARIIKTEEQIAADDAQRASQPDPNMMKMQIEMEALQIKKAELALKEKEFQFLQASEMQKAQWEHEEKLSANYARLRESEAQVLAAEKQERIELIKLAQADEGNRAKIMADMAKTNVNADTQKFLAGIDFTLEERKTAMQEQELELAKKEGHGALSTI